MRSGAAGCKENRMTVTLPVERKRCAEEELGTSVQSHKKSKVLESLLGSPRLLSHNSPGGSAFNLEGNNGTKGQKKRCRPGDTAAAVQQQEPSPPASNKRGKRADGSSTAAQSPRAAAAALQELLTCEGLEKDPDLEVQQAYISRQLQQRQAARQQPGAAASAAASDAADSSSSASRVSHEPPGSAAPASRRRSAAAAAADAEPRQELDAAKGGRGRDQAPQHGRSRDQVSSRPAAEAQERAHTPTPAEEDEEDGARVTLDIVADKEWQRLFAVLTLSGQPRSGPTATQQQQQAAAAAAQAAVSPLRQQPRYHAGAGTSASAAAAAAPPAADAPSTPTRREGETQAAAAAAAAGAVQDACVTPPSARRSFLLGEFSRVQARFTPERERTQLGTPGSSRQPSAMEVTC